MPNFLSVDTIAFTIAGYPMSYVELIGTVFYLWSVWLIAQRRILTWPVGIVSVVLYAILFYQIRLYSDTLEQIYYLFASVYGWWHWRRSTQDSGQGLKVSYSSRRNLIVWAVVTAGLSIGAGSLAGQVHVLLPALFPEPASFPFLDALTTVMSFVAMWLMARKRVESWIYWVIVDVIGIGLYYAKEVKFIALLYVILLALAIKGLVAWHRAAHVVE
jgi:nicotinamide mononucleotide transporter